MQMQMFFAKRRHADGATIALGSKHANATTREFLLRRFSPSAMAHSYAAPCSRVERDGRDEQSCSAWSCGSLSR